MSRNEHSLRPPQPLDLPYPLETLQPSPAGTSKSGQNNLDFFLSVTKQADPKDLKDHARKIQEEAYEIYHYPCIRRWAFMTTKAAAQAIYPHIIEMGRTDPDAIYLELGCFTGTDSRKLVYDGWDGKRVIGTDLRKDWFDLGYKLYNDREDCKITFLQGDIFSATFLRTPSSHDYPIDPPSSPTTSLANLASLEPLTGHTRAISAFSFFHLFSESAQYELAQKCAKLLSPKPGSVIFGAHQGLAKKGSIKRGTKDGKEEGMFCHSPESWKDLWEVEIFPTSRTSGKGVKVKVEAEFKDFPNLARAKDGSESETKTFMWSVMVV